MLMAESKVTCMAMLCRFIIDQMQPYDMLGIVTCSQEVAVPLLLQQLNTGGVAASKRLAKEVVDRIQVEDGRNTSSQPIHSKSSTTLIAGVKEGIRQLTAVPLSNWAVSGVFLFSGGQPYVSSKLYLLMGCQLYHCYFDSSCLSCTCSHLQPALQSAPSQHFYMMLTFSWSTCCAGFNTMHFIPCGQYGNAVDHSTYCKAVCYNMFLLALHKHLTCACAR